MPKLVVRTRNDDLVARARTEADALGQLYDLHYDRIFRFCLCRVFNRETAEDITSSVFLTVARGISGFRGATDSEFRNWLYTIAANQANSYIRKTSRRNRLLAEAAGSRIASGVHRADDPVKLDRHALHSAILKLKPKHQTIIILRFFEHLEFEQIGQILKARSSTVRVILHRALKKLRNQLQAVLNGGA